MAALSFINHRNPDATLIKLLKYLKRRIDPEAVISELDKHPDYPSMLSVSDVLASFGIENDAFRVEFDELARLECPFIAHTRQNGGDFMLVKAMENGNVYVANDKWDNHRLSTDEFKKLYNGIVLTFDVPEDNRAGLTLKGRLKVFKTPAMILGALLIVAAALAFHTTFFDDITWQSTLLALFKTVGLTTSVLLLIQSIDSNNPLVQVLCQTKGKTDCHAILSSKAAKVIDGLSWSEVGFFYFAGTWLLLLFGGNTSQTWQALAILNFISLPYTIYSIYYQARIAKQWCVLCCTIQAVLWLEFFSIVAVLTENPVSFGRGWNEAPAWSTLFICLLSPVILWLTIRPLLLKLQQINPLKEQLRKFKYNAELFNKMLTEQPKYTLPDEGWSIVLGNTDADTVITMVSNPYCPPCSKTHQLLDNLLNERPDIQARIVFTATNDEKDEKTPISRHLMALNDQADKMLVKQALHDWYEQKQKSYEAWAKTYPVELQESGFYKIDKQHAWCEMAEVTATPTLLLNGYRLPHLYQLQDLKYMVS